MTKRIALHSVIAEGTRVPKKTDGETRDARIVILLRPSEKARYLKMCEGKGEDFSRHAYKSLMGELEAWEAAN